MVTGEYRESATSGIGTQSVQYVWRMGTGSIRISEQMVSGEYRESDRDIICTVHYSVGFQ